LYSATLQPADAARAHEYGEIASLPVGFAEFLKGVFSGPDAPDSHDVAKALVELIATPAGKRPDRVLVRAGYGADEVNSAVKPIQAEMIRNIGFDKLQHLDVQ
jgi:hypothetical protein